MDYSELSACRLCPRECGVDRLNGQRGYCGVTGSGVRIARAAPHYWEEPCISGEHGSGTVFFSGCSLGCVYCQNRDISQRGAGLDVSVERLADIFMELEQKGVHNINLVTPTHYVLQIMDALDMARARGLALPIVYNTGSYDKPETLRRLEGYVDVYLPDFKYVSPELAAGYSAARDYPARARAAITEMLRQTGTPVFDKDGMMKGGVIVRHLMLPGCMDDSKAALKWLYESFGDNIFISIMNQYTPFDMGKWQELDRRITAEEYSELIAYAVDMGIENGFVQEDGTAEESFIPAFDNEGVLPPDNCK